MHVELSENLKVVCYAEGNELPGSGKLVEFLH
jgi:hypothetical protein